MEKIFDIAKDSEQSWGTLADAIDRNFDEASTGIQTAAQKDELDQVRSDLLQEVTELANKNDVVRTFESAEQTTTNHVADIKKGEIITLSATVDSESIPDDAIRFDKGDDFEQVFNVLLSNIANKGNFRVVAPCDLSRIRCYSTTNPSFKISITKKAEDKVYADNLILADVLNVDMPNINANKYLRSILLADRIAEGDVYYVETEVVGGSIVVSGSDIEAIGTFGEGKHYIKKIAQKEFSEITCENKGVTNAKFSLRVAKENVKDKAHFINVTNVVEVGNNNAVTSGAVAEVISRISVDALNPIVTIAAYNASENARLCATFKCTGNNDDEIINAAIQSLPIDGGEIHLSNGLFLISNPILIDKRIKIVGEGYGIAGIPKYTPTTEGANYENHFGSNVGGTTIRCTSDVDVIRVYANNKLQGIELKDFFIQGYGKDRHTKAGISVEVETDLFLMHAVSICDCRVGLYAYEHNMDAVQILNSSMQWCECGVIMKGVFGRFVGNCIADNNGLSEYKGVSVNTGGACIAGTCMSILDNQFVRTERYTIPKSGRLYDANRLGSAVVLGTSSSAAASFIVSNNTVNQNGGNGICLRNTNFTQIENNNISSYGASQQEGYTTGIISERLGQNTIIVSNRIGSPSAEQTTYKTENGVLINCTWGNNIVNSNMFTWLSGTDIQCKNSPANNVIINNLSIPKS